MLGQAEHTVEALIAEGAPLDQIEARIDELPLDREERSALWLLAWVNATNPAARRRTVSDRRFRLL
jgi:hypothetical protein